MDIKDFEVGRLGECRIQNPIRHADFVDDHRRVIYPAEIGVINKSGAWYAYEGNKIGQGRENAKQYLKDNPDVCATVEVKVREHYGIVADVAIEAENAKSTSKKSKEE